MAQNGEAYFRVNVFYPFLDYLLTALTDRFLCHRTNALTMQCLVPKITQTSSLIDIQPAIELYRMYCRAQLLIAEAEFVLWRSKCISGSISAENAFNAFEC